MHRLKLTPTEWLLLILFFILIALPVLEPRITDPAYTQGLILLP